MHIPENYLSPETCGILTVAMIPVWVVSVKKIKEQLPQEKITLLGVGAAFSFLGMMFNVPMPGGTTGHAVGGTLIAFALGPYAACIAVSVALFLQALLFGDGGILSFGANCFNMAFVLPFIGYYFGQFLKEKVFHFKNADLVSVGVGSYAGINAAALCAAIEFGIQPLLFKDALGNALYCPYDLRISIPSMMIGHLTIFGLAEVIFTVGIYAFLKSSAPEVLFQKDSIKTGKPLGIFLAALILCTPLGLLAEGTAWGEWGTEEMIDLVGYTPVGMSSGFEWSSLFPDYSISGLPDVAGYILSAIIGVALLTIIFKLLSNIGKEKIA